MQRSVGIVILLLVSVSAQKDTKKGDNKIIGDADPYNYDPYYG